MHSELAAFIRDTPEGAEASAILAKCVHCGFCTAVCPSYQVLGDDLDSPRGRIYLMKRALEGAPVTDKTRLHLDRCLTCRACETACPSGVEYGRLVDIGRAVVEDATHRSPLERMHRRALGIVLSNRKIFHATLSLGRLFKPLMPAAMRKRIPPKEEVVWPQSRHQRRMLALAGCVQGSLAPSINAATARVLDRLGISLIEAPGAGCCGALRFHLNEQEAGRDDMRRLIDRWWPLIESGAIEAIVMTASGCGVTVKDFGRLLAQDDRYREKAAHISAITKDLSEIISPDAFEQAQLSSTVAFQSPCSLQHGQRILGNVEALLLRAGYRLTPVNEAHLCCGSAGTYSILHPEIAGELRTRKLQALQIGTPDFIATANIGCLSHLQAESSVPVLHWVQLLDRALTPPGQ